MPTYHVSYDISDQNPNPGRRRSLVEAEIEVFPTEKAVRVANTTFWVQSAEKIAVLKDRIAQHMIAADRLVVSQIQSPVRPHIAGYGDLRGRLDAEK